MNGYSTQQGGKEKGETMYSYQKANRLIYSLFMVPKELSVYSFQSNVVYMQQLETTPEMLEEEEFGEKSNPSYDMVNTELISCSISERRVTGLEEADLVVSTESLGESLSIEQCDSILNELDLDNCVGEVV